jgi:hypothetical protein
MAQNSSTLGAVIGIVIGALLLVVAIAKPAFLWNFDAIAHLRGSFGDTVARILFGVAGVIVLGGGLLGLITRKKA